MNVAFRVDATQRLSIGHVMRCLTLAQVLSRAGARVRFVAAAISAALAEKIAAAGHELVHLDTGSDNNAHGYALGSTWQRDADATRAALATPQCDWLVVDHYGIDARWHAALRPHVGHLLVIDDLADRPLQCDLLLDQTLGRRAEDYAGRLAGESTLLLGTAYCLLRPEFARLRRAAARKRRAREPLRKILIAMGGTDPDNVSAIVLEGLARVAWSQRPGVDLVLAAGAPHLDDLRHRLDALPLDARILTGVDDMAALMLSADVAIGAAGGTAWERCCLGLPTLQVVTADNQRAVSRGLAAAGAALAVGNRATLKSEGIADAMTALVENAERRAAMAAAAFRVCDGLGASRVAGVLQPELARDGTPVALRPATQGDADLLFRWQSNPAVRHYFNNPQAPPYAEHVAWLNARLDDATGHLNVILLGNAAAGSLRLDPADSGDDTYIVSILIDPDRQQLGIAGAALNIARRMLPDATLHAQVHADNRSSHALFRRTGYVYDDALGVYVNKGGSRATQSAP